MEQIELLAEKLLAGINDQGCCKQCAFVLMCGYQIEQEASPLPSLALFAGSFRAGDS